MFVIQHVMNSTFLNATLLTLYPTKTVVLIWELFNFVLYTPYFFFSFSTKNQFFRLGSSYNPSSLDENLVYNSLLDVQLASITLSYLPLQSKLALLLILMLINFNVMLTLIFPEKMAFGFCSLYFTSYSSVSHIITFLFHYISLFFHQNVHI